VYSFIILAVCCNAFNLHRLIFTLGEKFLSIMEGKTWAKDTG